MDILNHPELLVSVDWNQMISKVNLNTYFTINKSRIQEPPPLRSIEEIEKDYQLIHNLIEYIPHHSDISLAEFLPDSLDLNESFSYLSKNPVLSLNILNQLSSVSECFFANSNFIGAMDEELFHVAPDRIQKFSKNCLSRFRRFCSRSGEINFHADSLLSKICSNISSLEEKIKNTVNFLLKSSKFKNILQYDQYDIYYDHFVLPIRSDSYQGHLGSIIDRSNSGSTLYVEPAEVRALSEELILAFNTRDERIQQILKEFSDSFFEFRFDLKIFYNSVIVADYYRSLARFSLDHNLVQPSFNQDEVLEITDFFHPLIESPVPNSIHFSKNEKLLVISGPNAGGKSVILKSIALIYLFAHKGLFVPAKEANLFFFDKIFFFNADLQDISEGLSSFSSEVKSYSSLLKSMTKKSLILIDEIFNSTSSEEASALAIAMFNYIRKKNISKVIFTTHHLLLKNHYASDPTAISASVTFDKHTSLPKYKLVFGSPGSSNAIETFHHYTKDLGEEFTAIYSEAKGLLDSEYIKYDSLLNDLEKKNYQLDQLISEQESVAKKLESHKLAIDESLRLKKEKELGSFKKALSRKIEQVENLYNELKSSKSISKKELEEVIHQSKEPIRSASPAKQLEASNRDLPFIGIGDVITVAPFGKKASVLKRNQKGELYVQVGSLKSWVKENQILEVNSRTVENKDKYFIDISSSSSLEHDCRGMRLEDFKDIYQDALTSLNREQVPFVDLIHGHGSGILKNWLRETVKKNRDLKWERLEGNDGVTRISLKSD